MAKLGSEEGICNDGLREQDDADNTDTSKNAPQTTWETDCYLPRGSTTRDDPTTLKTLLWSWGAISYVLGMWISIVFGFSPIYRQLALDGVEGQRWRTLGPDWGSCSKMLRQVMTCLHLDNCSNYLVLVIGWRGWWCCRFWLWSSISIYWKAFTWVAASSWFQRCLQISGTSR